MQQAANQAMRLVWYGEAQLRAGRPDVARRLAGQALETARRHGERGHEAYALRLLGDLTAGDRSGSDEARGHYRAALALAERLGMQPLAAAVASCLP
jgi:hypothetical protein